MSGGPAPRNAVRERLRQAGIDPDGSGPKVALGLAAASPAPPPPLGLGAPPRWPWRRFVELSRRLRKERPAVSLLLLTGTHRLWDAVRIHERTGRIVPVLGPELEPDGWRALVAELDLLVTSDPELAAAAHEAGTRVVATHHGNRWLPRRSPVGRVVADCLEALGTDPAG